MGWFAVSRRLIGQLLFPASALLSALYPTLCRLYTSDLPAFIRTTRGALASVALLVVPVALGCLLYPEIGISIFSRKSFGPAEDNLRISSLFIFLVYFTMPLGICILAAGKQRAWSIVQSLCIVVSLVLDPILVPWFQTRNKNGGLGLSLAGVLSEVLVVACGIALAPRGIFDRRFARLLALALISGAAMTLVAYALRSINSFIAAPIALCAYGVALVLTGAVEKQQIQAARALVSRKLSRSR
jgi:O-antigen/teichoic acid export membrane protein